ncbi:Uncharacterized sigma-54-dependent transcriptional regulator YgeV [Klebsiella pneumoniae IS22]|nr:Uncharacterized sigma-54-dependent transcriptional regulator YgeV [Klebsiella pneumoniae IS22]
MIQAANTGTLFLDEIGDMPLMLQAKLLRAIEAREILPIGASSPIQVDIRIILQLIRIWPSSLPKVNSAKISSTDLMLSR